jgi:hypothetical protein
MNFATRMLIEAKRLGLAQGVPNAIGNIHQARRFPVSFSPSSAPT